VEWSLEITLTILQPHNRGHRYAVKSALAAAKFNNFVVAPPTELMGFWQRSRLH
jgi:hypothetical protein